MTKEALLVKRSRAGLRAATERAMLLFLPLRMLMLFVPGLGRTID